MAKRTTVDATEKLKNLIEGNNSISVNLQNKLMRHVNQLAKHTKPVEPKEKQSKGASQFEKKMHVSAEMAKFAKWNEDELKSRVEVTKAIWDYAKAHSLRDEKNKRNCVLDETLKTLLGTDSAVLTYPQIQKYIGKHFIK